MTDSPFVLDVVVERELPAGTRQVDVALTVTATAAPGHGPGPHAEVLLLDCSESMSFPLAKLVAATAAATAAVNSLPDGVLFAVVAGNRDARMIYPAQPQLVEASGHTRREAAAALARVGASGGTAIGAWLRQALALFGTRPDASAHAILLTDGQNESEFADDLDGALTACAGRFVCDARGIGDGWEPEQLRRIAGALRGTADIADEQKLPEDFRALTASAMRKALPQLRIRFQTMKHARLRAIKQVHPQSYDLTERLDRISEGIVELGTGSWALGDLRSYFLQFHVDSAIAATDIGRDRQVAAVSLEPDFGAAPVPILVRPTGRPPRPTVVRAELAEFPKRNAMEAAVEAGYDFLARGERADAEQVWAEAIRLAGELGESRLLERLGRVVCTGPDGAVRIREDVSRTAILAAAIGASIPVRPHPRAPAQGTAAVVGCPQPDCTGISPAGANYCTVCGHDLAAP